jgi:hypothetical protein
VCDCFYVSVERRLELWDESLQKDGMPSPQQHYAVMLNMAREHREGKRPIDAASPAVRKKVISETPEDAAERKPPTTTKSHDPATPS